MYCKELKRSKHKGTADFCVHAEKRLFFHAFAALSTFLTNGKACEGMLLCTDRTNLKANFMGILLFTAPVYSKDALSLFCFGVIDEEN